MSPQITFIRPDGTTLEVVAKSGVSLMETALDSGIDEILAECGGNATCATCHVYVDVSSAAKLPPMSQLEDEMLDGTAAPRRGNSRLSCQLIASEEIDGLRVELPDVQW